MRVSRLMTSLFIILGAPLAVFGSEQDSVTPSKPQQHALSIDGENHLSFLAAAALEPAKIEYRARVEYLVKTRNAQEVEADAKSANKKKSRTSRARTSKKVKKTGTEDEPEQTVAFAVDIAIHAAEMEFPQNSQTVVQSRSNDLANAAGVTVAHAKGKMVVDSKMMDVAPTAGEQQDGAG